MFYGFLRSSDRPGSCACSYATGRLLHLEVDRVESDLAGRALPEQLPSEFLDALPSPTPRAVYADLAVYFDAIKKARAERWPWKSIAQVLCQKGVWLHPDGVRIVRAVRLIEESETHTRVQQEPEDALLPLLPSIEPTPTVRGRAGR